MSKNPFVNCRSRKRRKPRTVNYVHTDEKRYCPRTMVRYDNTDTGFPTVWVCKMCLATILSEINVEAHIEKCKIQFNSKPEPPVKNDEEPKYICEICDRVFSRKVTLKQHREQHIDNTPSDLESDIEDNTDVQDYAIFENILPVNDNETQPVNEDHNISAGDDNISAGDDNISAGDNNVI